MGFHTNQQGKLFKRSMLAMCVMAISSPGFAADAAKNTDKKAVATDVEEVVVTGMKAALGNAQDIKRKADTVVDSITAKDLGSFPDKSVGEALQRVAGITVNRFAASSDTAHFSAEPSGVIVRGLQQVRTEFNGHDSFSANSARGLSWGDVSPELMAGVDTYKNQTAELIEGGIAGTVNMRTRTPFDQAGDKYSVSVNTNYNTLVNKYTPELSGLISHRWETGAGQFGILGSLAYSNVTTRSEGIHMDRLDRIAPGVYGTDEKFIPDGIFISDNTYDRTRKGASIAAEWKDDEDKYHLKLILNRSEYHNGWEEYVVKPNMGNTSYSQSVFWQIPVGSAKLPKPPAGAPAYTFDKNGYLTKGTMTWQEGWWADGNKVKNDQGQLWHKCYDWSSCSSVGDVQTGVYSGIYMTTATRANDNKNLTQDISLNFKWNPSDTLEATFDVQRVSSTVKNYDISTEFDSLTNATFDLSGSLPSITLGAPDYVNMSRGGYSNARNYYLKDIMDHLEDSAGHELAVRADFKFTIDSGWIDSVKVGVRRAEREQDVHWTKYNWQNVSNAWTSGPERFFLDSNTAGASGFKGYPDFYTTKKWDSNFGSLTTYDSGNKFVFAKMDMLKNQKLWASQMSASAMGLTFKGGYDSNGKPLTYAGWDAKTGGNGWDPICSNIGDRSDEVAGTCFTPAELTDITETTNAAYAQLNFGGEKLTLLGKPLSGNVGVRLVKTTIESIGGEAIPKLDANDLDASANLDPMTGAVGPVPNKVGYYLSAADKSFANGAIYTGTATANHTHVLPSLNLKWELDDEWLLRMALSKAIARPDVGNLRNYINVGKTLPSSNNVSDPLWIKNSSGTITGANVKYKADAQNPYLAPIQAKQLDISLEYYFAKVGSFSVTLFGKEFSDYIQFGTYYRNVTNNGVTRQVEVKGPINGDGATLNGVEVAFQRFFDFLPAPWDGLGVQLNATDVHNNGITNAKIANTGASSSTISSQAPDSVGVASLEAMSEHSYNFILMYEKDAWAARAAYSWRSEYLITAVDCCVAVPVWNKATGQLDASVSYKFSDNLTVVLSGSNLLNERTVLTQQINSSDKGGMRVPNGWFQNDVRYTLGLRLNY